MADFEKAFAYTMQFEDSAMTGVVATDTNGALVRFGVNAAAHPELLKTGFYDRGSVSNEEALCIVKNIARNNYWNAVHGDEIVDQSIANKTFDRAYQSGPREAAVLLQRVARLFCFELVVDGVIGPRTIAAVNQCPSPVEFLAKLRLLNRAFIAAWASNQPDISSRMYSAVVARASA